MFKNYIFRFCRDCFSNVVGFVLSVFILYGSWYCIMEGKFAVQLIVTVFLWCVILGTCGGLVLRLIDCGRWVRSKFKNELAFTEEKECN